MASVFKRKRRNKNGKIVEANKFTCQYLDPVTGKTCRAPGYSDRSESRRLADKLEAGTATTDHRKHRKTPLADHLAAFVCHLRAINNAEKYIKVVETRITRILDGCNFETLRHITLPALENWLAAEREKKSFGIATSNEYGSAFKSFLTWLADSDRAESNPVARFSPLNDTDVKREYRALTPDEFSRLISSTLAGPAYRTMSGADRAMLYLVASYSGLRASELASLTAESFEGDFVLVEAAFSKRRRLDRQPLPADLVEAMRGWLPGRSGKLWPGSWSHDAAAMLRPDLALAGIPDVDVVFHSLRHTYITALALANVPPKVAQVLARHSDINLTMIRYAHVTDSDAVAGLARLPAMPTLTLGLTQAPVTNGHDVARIGTTLDGQSEPNAVVIPLPNGYLSKKRPISYGSPSEAMGRFSTCPVSSAS